MKNSLKNKKILVTGGPTWVAIDSVRILSNISSGEMSHLICDNLVKNKAKVTLIQGQVSNLYQNKKVTIKKFTYFDELSKLLKQELKNTDYDCVIHAAAVSDFKLDKSFKTKLSSDNKELNLRLVPTKKIINDIKTISRKSFLVGFKLENNFTKKTLVEETKGLFNSARCDLVVANSLNKGKYLGYILDKDQDVLVKVDSKETLASQLIEILRKTL